MCHPIWFENAVIKHTGDQRDHSGELYSILSFCVNLLLCFDLLHSKNQMPANKTTDSFHQGNCTYNICWDNRYYVS